MNKYKLLAILFLSINFFISCSSNHDHEEEADHHEHEGTSITQFSDYTEIFMEYPALVVNQETKFLIHLTDLKDFKAVTEGILTVTFKNDQTEFSKKEDNPARDGIFIPVIKFEKAGTYTMEISLRGNQVSDNIIVNNVIVFSSENDIPHSHEESPPSISFLKEQQWKIEFHTEFVKKQNLQSSVIATGEIIAKPEYYSKVVAPVPGIVFQSNNLSFPKQGMFVNKGSILLNVSPSSDVNVNIGKIKNDFLLAKSEYERVQKLFDKNAVAQKRLDEAKFDFESKQNIYNTITQQVKFTENGFAVIAPISGYIENISISLGSQIEIGQELFTIVNPSKLILVANLPANNFNQANESKDASFKVEGYNKEFSISKLNGRKISVSSSLNQQNRTIPIYYEFDNPQNLIKVGMYAEVFVKTGELKNTIVIPETAIIDEEGMHTAYVQAEGEAFEKRILKTGITDNGLIEVLEGINENERIVTKGAYQVRLAALSPESAIGHGHVH
ncbi:MAG: efflux RND transporter periplasmic adaptor subunit [Ignavibacteriae bacterium]|nr:efflux RND transporter periplasmic adaptor subunit [Ignavibacteriota bacterium]